MSFTGGLPPGPHAGAISPLTEALRPPIGLSSDQCDAARELRRRGRKLEEIAAGLAVPEEEVRQALATMRTRKPTASRRSLNVTVAAHEFVIGEVTDSEACWETVDRLLVELVFRRAFAGSPTGRLG